jgi:hypothetical protein
MGTTAYLVLQALLIAEPLIAQSIDLAKMQSDLTPEQMAGLTAARDQAIADYKAGIKAE